MKNINRMFYDGSAEHILRLEAEFIDLLKICSKLNTFASCEQFFFSVTTEIIVTHDLPLGDSSVLKNFTVKHYFLNEINKRSNGSKT